jgi:hypothetical protein
VDKVKPVTSLITLTTDKQMNELLNHMRAAHHRRSPNIKSDKLDLPVMKDEGWAIATDPYYYVGENLSYEEALPLIEGTPCLACGQKGLRHVYRLTHTSITDTEGNPIPIDMGGCCASMKLPGCSYANRCKLDQIELHHHWLKSSEWETHDKNTIKKTWTRRATAYISTDNSWVVKHFAKILAEGCSVTLTDAMENTFQTILKMEERMFQFRPRKNKSEPVAAF